MFTARLACVVIITTASVAAQAGPFECDPSVDLCALLPRRADGGTDFNVPGGPGFDPAKPWVLGQSQILTLTPGTYAPGVSAFGSPAVFIADNATLTLGPADAGAPDGGPLPDFSLAAALVLCNQGQLRVTNAHFHAGGPVYALEQSHVDYANAQLSAVPPGSTESGTLTQLMMQDASLTVNGATFDTQQVFELEVLHNATATVAGLQALGEIFLSGTASVNVSNSALFAVFFHACPGASYTFDNLPALCDLSVAPGMTGSCFPAPLLTYATTGPAGSAFTLDVTGTQLFAWGLVTYPGSTVSTSNVPMNANFTVGLTLPSSLDLLLQAGAAPVSTGLTDRTLTFTGTALRAWDVWPSSGAAIVLEPGSAVADVTPSGTGTTVLGTQVTSASGNVTAPFGTEVDLRDCTLGGLAASTGGTLRLTRCTLALSGGLTAGGPVFLADSPLPSAEAQLSDAGVLHQVALATPVNGAVYTAGALSVTGLITASNAQGALATLPAAHLSVSRAGALLEQWPVAVAVFDGGLIMTLDAGSWAPGAYEVALAFDEDAPLIDGGGAVSRRTFTLGIADAGAQDAGAQDAGLADAGTSDAGTPDAGAADAGRPDSGTPSPPDAGPPGGTPGSCGCGTLGAPQLLWLLALALRRRVRASGRGATASR